MNTSELYEIEQLLKMALSITHSLPRGFTETNPISGQEDKNTKLLLKIQQKLLKELDELVSKAGS